MSARQRDWASRKRDEILEILGAICANCGSTEELTFDVIIPVDSGPNGHHKKEWSWRMSFYRQQLANKNLQVLCDPCNVKKSNKVLPQSASEE